MRKGKDPDAVGMEKGNVTSIWKETLSLLFLLGTKVNVEGRWELSGGGCVSKKRCIAVDIVPGP